MAQGIKRRHSELTAHSCPVPSAFSRLDPDDSDSGICYIFNETTKRFEAAPDTPENAQKKAEAQRLSEARLAELKRNLEWTKSIHPLPTPATVEVKSVPINTTKPFLRAPPPSPMIVPHEPTTTTSAFSTFYLSSGSPTTATHQGSFP